MLRRMNVRPTMSFMIYAAHELAPSALSHFEKRRKVGKSSRNIKRELRMLRRMNV